MTESPKHSRKNDRLAGLTKPSADGVTGSPPTDQDALALQSGGVYSVLSRAMIEVGGEDRATFLHNLCTNDVRRLAPGEGCEAFFTNVQGKTILYGLLFCEDRSIVIEFPAGVDDGFLAHLDKYLIREDVTLVDRSDEWTEIWVAGPLAATCLADIGLSAPEEMLSSSTGTVNGIDVRIRRVPFATASCFLVQIQAHDFQTVLDRLGNTSCTSVGHEIVELARIEAGFPNFGQDISESNLPQEVGRDATAISFTKGCYLGQETVARIDALGHVNRCLVRLRFTSGDPSILPGATLRHDGSEVGRVTSSCWSPISGHVTALGYLRREVVEAGKEVESDFGPVQVAPPLG